jgi:DNA-binding IclR family transcriptional regulator
MARPAPAADRAATILSYLTAHPSRAYSLSELVKHLGMNIASAHATLAVLTNCGFVIRDPVHRTYVLGPALAATGFAALEQHPAIAAAIEQAAILASELDVETGVSSVAGGDVILLARRGPEPATPGLGYPGERTAMLAPFGAVFMAWDEATAVDEWLARGGFRGKAADFYRGVLADIRARGFSVPLDAVTPAVRAALVEMRNEPTGPGAEQRLAEALRGAPEGVLSLEGRSSADQVDFRTVAAPVFDPIGRVILSLSVSGPGHRVRVQAVIDLGRRVAQAASIATRQARGRSPDADVMGGTASR